MKQLELKKEATITGVERFQKLMYPPIDDGSVGVLLRDVSKEDIKCGDFLLFNGRVKKDK